MRKTMMISAVVASVAMSTAALAAPGPYYSGPGYAGGEVAAGTVTGAVVGVGLYEGWFGSSAAVAGSVLPVTAAGAATVGGVAGVGTVALIDSAIQPCQGFHAVFGMNRDACVNGQYVGYAQPRRVIYRR
jgi:hypothetical protein